MPKLIFITTLPLWSMGKGHGGPAFTQTAKKYIDEGWEVFLISDEPSNVDYPALDTRHNIFLPPSPFKKYGQIRKLGLLFRWLDHRFMTRTFCRRVEALLADNERDTVLYAYEVFGVEACRRLAAKHDLPFVTRFQGTILSQFQNTTINHIRRYPHYQALSQRANLVIMTDDGTQGDRVLQELHNDSPCICFWRNGLELLERDIHAMKSAFDRTAFRASLGVEEGETMFLTVSRLTGWKKVERAIDGFAESLKTAPNSKLVIVGDGDSRSALEKRVNSLGIGERVVFTGAVPHDEVYSYMMACDVFVSLYDLSNVGNPLLEAMTLGKCIVTLDVGDTKKLIHDRETGMLMTYDSLPRLGGVFAALAQDPSLCQRLGDAAGAYARENFWSWKARMDAELREVSALLARSSSLCPPPASGFSEF